mgnify:CR=1 FL=1
MATLPIIIAPDPRLKVKSSPVKHIDEAINVLMDNMLETMYDAHGIGLAAPQIGITQRIVVIDVEQADVSSKPIVMVNPEVTWESDNFVTRQEGCLSLPDSYAEIDRPEIIKVRFINRRNETCEMRADGILATCVQHEIDHLDGILFIDHISSLKRKMILRKLAKVKRHHLK